MTWVHETQDGNVEMGHPACAGCGMVLGVRHLLAEAGDDTVAVVPASCASVIQGVYPYTAFDVPVVNTAFAAGPSTASGVQMALEQHDEDTDVVVIAGDGGSTDIGLSSLSGVLERDHDLTYVLYDNEAYSNTGFQKSGRTPEGARTTTTPTGRRGRRKDITEIVEAHDPAYMATVSPSHLEDLSRKAERAIDTEGATFIHMLAPCPPGWRIDTADTVSTAEAAVESGLWVLYERKRGGDIRVNGPSERALRDPTDVEAYVEPQGRFATGEDGGLSALREQAEANRERFARHVEGVDA